MATNFPGSIDNGTSLPYPGALDSRNNPSLAGVESNQNDAVIATQTKLGIGASLAANNKLLIGTGAGASAWLGTAPASHLFVGTTDTQTLTNKTLTSPIITSPTISNAAISADAYVGYSSANTGTIFGMSVAASKLNGSYIDNLTVNTAQLADGSVTTPKLAASSVTPAKLTNPYTFAAYMGSTQSTVLNTFTKLNYDTKVFDPNNNFNTTTKGYTIPVNGYYSVTLSAQLLGQVGQPWIISLSKDGSTEFIRGQEVPNTTGNILLSATFTLKLAANEIIYGLYYSGTASKTINNGSVLSRFSAILLYPY